MAALTFGTPQGAAGGVLDVAPATADSRDEEFSGSALGAWSATGTWSAEAFDHYTDSTLAKTRYDWNTIRKSWLLLQNLRDATSRYLHKAITVASTTQFFARISLAQNPGGGANGGIIGLWLGQSNAGAPDTANNVILTIRSDASNWKVLFEKNLGGNTTLTTEFNHPVTAAYVYLLIQRNGNTYSAWIAGADGGWRPQGQHTAALTPDRVALIVNNSDGAAQNVIPGPPVHGVDFMRFRDSLLLPGCG